jgi:hypothetical protein
MREALLISDALQGARVDSIHIHVLEPSIPSRVDCQGEGNHFASLTSMAPLSDSCKEHSWVTWETPSSES